METRTEEAITLLLKSNLSCTEIAPSCHCSSCSGFFRSFKRHCRVSPETSRNAASPQSHAKQTNEDQQHPEIFRHRPLFLQDQQTGKKSHRQTHLTERLQITDI